MTGETGRRGWAARLRSRRPWALAAAVGLGAAVLAGLVTYVVIPRPAAVIGASPAAATRSPAVLPSPGSSPGAGLARLAAGRKAPGFSLPRLGGGAPVSLAADAGHPVVLNFFASWCPDCRKEMSAFATVSAGSTGPVRFLGVDTSDHNQPLARKLLRAAGDRYPVGVDPSAKVANGDYLVPALPATVFIGANGRIAGQAFGAQSVTALRSWVRTLEKTAGS